MLGGNERKILIVDDEAPIRTLLRSAVGGPGFCVFEAESAEAALQIASGNAPFALVMSDIVMPGMDGFELATKLVATGAAQNFLMMSGYANMDDLTQRMAGMPVARFLSKPFLIADLLRVTSELLTVEIPAARSASVRERPRTDFRAPAHPLAGIRALLRKSRRLRAERDRLVENIGAGRQVLSSLRREARTKVTAIARIERQVVVPRAMVEECCGTPSLSPSC